MIHNENLFYLIFNQKQKEIIISYNSFYKEKIY